MTDPAVPTLRTAGGLADALDPAALRDAPSSDALLAFLADRRWFGAKALAPRAARVVATIPVPDALIAVVEVELGDGARERYQLPLARRGVDELVDATHDRAFLDWLGRAVVEGARVEGEGGSLVAEPVGASSPRMQALEPRTSSAEQSNTSIVYGDQAILKLYRKLEAGENPDVEISHFLTTRAHFAHTPALLGTIRIDGPEGSSVAGMMQRLVPRASDAWVYTLDRARGDVAGDAARPSYAVDAASLGRVTRALHEALASGADEPAFAPRPASGDDLARWADAARRTVASGLELLERAVAAGAIRDGDADLAHAALRARAALDSRAGELASDIGADAGAMMRHHGDYHLGQLLRSERGEWYIIDFEGEPARPLADRRAPNSPLRDVAGMVRSFAYAAATVAAEGASRARAAAWEQQVRDAFLEAYFGMTAASDATALPHFLPRRFENAMSLVALFELEKLFYELAYELNNRPGWAWIPLRGMAPYATTVRSRGRVMEGMEGRVG